MIHRDFVSVLFLCLCNLSFGVMQSYNLLMELKIEKIERNCFGREVMRKRGSLVVFMEMEV